MVDFNDLVLFCFYYGADVYVMSKKAICKYVFTMLQISLGLLYVKSIHIKYIYIYNVCLK